MLLVQGPVNTAVNKMEATASTHGAYILVEGVRQQTEKQMNTW